MSVRRVKLDDGDEAAYTSDPDELADDDGREDEAALAEAFEEEERAAFEEMEAHEREEIQEVGDHRKLDPTSTDPRRKPPMRLTEDQVKRPSFSAPLRDYFDAQQREPDDEGGESKAVVMVDETAAEWFENKLRKEPGYWLDRKNDPRRTVAGVEAALGEAADSHGLDLGDLRRAFEGKGRPSAAERAHREQVRDVLMPPWMDSDRDEGDGGPTTRALLAEALGTTRPALYRLMNADT